MFNFQKYRHIPSPGWTLGWKWAKKEVIWSMVGAQTTEQVQRNITCTYSQFLAQRTPTCCVSLSSFYNKTIVGCPTCTCGCQNNKTESVSTFVSSGSVFNHKVSNFVSSFGDASPDTPHLASVVSPPTKKGTVLPPLVQCTRHLCPIRVHWHWRVKITITNFNYRLNYSQWNMVAQHPNLDNIPQIFSFNYKSLTPYAGLNDTAGPFGNVQSEILFRKDQATFTQQFSVFSAVLLPVLLFFLFST
nr:unnamed protein product [Brassica rapa]